MDKIVIDFDVLRINNLSVNEYLTLYKCVFPGKIDDMYAYRKQDLIGLEKKGFIKVMTAEIILREKSKELFHVGTDFFLTWLLAYPIRVNKSHGGTRSLSPASDDTILGKRLRAKWKKIFKGNPEEEKKAIKVLEAEVEMRKKSGDLEYMVEASRWLNEGFHEKYSYLLEEEGKDPSGINYNNEEDWV